MSDLFLKILNLSLSAGYLVLAVVFLRFLLKKAPKWTRPLLWGLVALRLVFPISIESVLSLLPSAQVIPADIGRYQTPAIDTGFQAVDRAVNPVITETFAPAPGASANPLQIWLEIGGWVWAMGAAVMLMYTLISYWNLRRRVRGAGLVEKNIYRSRGVDTPFVLGLFRPKIYLPMDLSEEEASYIVAHEEAHLRRGDQFWKPLGFVLLSIHWFNPLMWLAYILLCRDMELACDEKVIKTLSRRDRAAYSQALLNCSVSRRTVAACPLAFGEVGVKQRVKSVLSYKKPGFWIVALALIACVVTAVCFLTNPKSPDEALSLSQVRQIAKNGSGLGWSDFEGYAYEKVDETTRRYAVEGVDFTLTVKVAHQNQPPRSVILSCNLEGGTGIDIRNGGLDEYLAVHIQGMDPLAENHWSVCANVNNPAPDGAEFSISCRAEKNNAEFYTTEGYVLQTRGADGDWENMPMLRAPNWSESRISVGPVYIQKANWEDLYGPLPDGDYRLCKEVIAELPWDQGAEQFTAYSEFGIYYQGRTALTEEKLSELLNDPEGLEWEDFEDYIHHTRSNPYLTSESLRYFQSYQIGENLSLHISGTGPEEQLVRLLLQCSVEESQMAYLYPHKGDPEYWDREISQAVAEAQEMQTFIKVHGAPRRDEHTNHFGVRFAIENADASEASVQFTVNPTLDAPYTASDYYELQKFEGGTWMTLEPLGGQEWGAPQFREENLSSQTIQWKSRYGVLPEGRYRLGKEIQIGDWNEVGMPIWSPLMVYDEFTVGQEEKTDVSNTYGLTIQTHEVTPDHLVLTFQRRDGAPRQLLYRMSGFTLEKRNGSNWEPLYDNTRETVEENIKNTDADPENGLYLMWEDLGSLPDGQYRMGQEIATSRILNEAERFTVYAEFTVNTEGWTNGVVPLGQLPENYHPEDAQIDGCVVMTDGQVRSGGEEIFSAFKNKAYMGEPAFLRFVNSFLGEGGYTVFVHDLSFDGETYTLRWLEEGEEQVKTYEHLVSGLHDQRHTGDNGINYTELFVLTNDKNLNADDLIPENRGIQNGVDMDHEVVCSIKTVVPGTPEIPGDIVRAVLDFKGETVAELEEGENLNALVSMFRNAQVFGGEPKTHDIGIGLHLTLTAEDGRETVIELCSISDMCRIDGVYIWYGAADEEDYIEKLWDYFDMEAWPEAVYERSPGAYRKR